MSREDTLYEDWKREVAGKLPEDVRTSFTALTEHEAGREVFRGNLRRADYDRRVGEVEAERRRLKEWFEGEAPKNPQLVAQNQELAQKLASYEKTLKDYGLENDLSTPNPNTAPSPSVVRKDDIEQIRREMNQKINGLDQALPALLGDLSTVIHRSIKEGYNIDPREVIAYAAENRVNPIQAFESLTTNERSRRAVADQKVLEEKWKDEGRREALSKLPSPTYIRPAGPTVVEQLNNKDFASDARTRVGDSVKAFLEGGYASKDNGSLV